MDGPFLSSSFAQAALARWPPPTPQPRHHPLLAHSETYLSPRVSQLPGTSCRDVAGALRLPTAHVRKSVAHAGPPTREALTLSFGSGLSSLGLPGSQGKVAGRRTRAQDAQGHVVAALPRPSLVGAPRFSRSERAALTAQGLLPPLRSATGRQGQPGLLSAPHSHNAWRGARRLLGAVVRSAHCVRRGGGRSCRRPGRAGSESGCDYRLRLCRLRRRLLRPGRSLLRGESEAGPPWSPTR